MAHAQSVYRSWLDDEGEAFAAALDGDPATAVPSCPGWSIADLAAHVGSYHRWAADLLTDAGQEPRAPYALRPDPDLPLAGWYRTCLHLLRAAIDATEPDTAMWTVTVEQRAGSWCRRQTHDLAIHRWDAQDARGHATPVAVERAVDFIDELFESVLPYTLPFLGRTVPGASLHLQSTDGRYRRCADGADGRIRLSRRPRSADAVLTGTPSDLLLALWRRPSRATLTGDPACLIAWQAAVDGPGTAA
jgi:uncharacterized protein (TIGR03083 family)